MPPGQRFLISLMAFFSNELKSEKLTPAISPSKRPADSIGSGESSSCGGTVISVKMCYHNREIYFRLYNSNFNVLEHSSASILKLSATNRVQNEVQMKEG